MPQQQVNTKNKIMKDLKQFTAIELRTQDQININGGTEGDITVGDVAYATGYVLGVMAKYTYYGFFNKSC